MATRDKSTGIYFLMDDGRYLLTADREKDTKAQDGDMPIPGEELEIELIETLENALSLVYSGNHNPKLILSELIQELKKLSNA